jgi:alpha-glucosidase
MLLTLRGTAFLYYGDELGMPDTDVPRDRLLDPVSIRFAPVHNRDAARTPMPWNGDDGAGFTAAGIEPWLPFGDIGACNVADQRGDPGSTLHLVKDLIALRRELPDLRDGTYERIALDGGLWAWRRGASVVVALNLAGTPATLDGVGGTIRLGTVRARDGEPVDGALRLGPWEGALVTVGERAVESAGGGV